MRDVGELVRRDQLAPHAEVANLFARIGGGGKKDDRRRVQRGEGGTIGVVDGVIDDDVHSPGREIANDAPHLLSDSFHAPGEGERPGAIALGKVKDEVLRLHRAPVEPWTHRLRLGSGTGDQRGEHQKCVANAPRHCWVKKWKGRVHEARVPFRDAPLD